MSTPVSPGSVSPGSGTTSPSQVVLVTAPSTEVAATIARDVVERRLAACGNIVPGVRSIYSWEGEIHDDAEVLLILKTRAGRFEDLRARVVELHPYDCPEVLALEVAAGHGAYLKWIANNVDP